MLDKDGKESTYAGAGGLSGSALRRAAPSDLRAFFAAAGSERVLFVNLQPGGAKSDEAWAIRKKCGVHLWPV